MDKINARGRLIAGVAFDIPGMGYKNPRTGAIDGFEADVARAIAERLVGGRDRVDFVPVTDANRIDVVQSERADMVVSQITITPDRAEQVDFSIPYYVTREALIVPKGSAIKGFDDLKGKRIAATEGSISIRRMRAALPSLPGATLVVTPLNSGGLAAVARGEADAASNDLINLTMLRDASPHPDDYAIVDIGDRFEEKPFGVAMKKGNGSLVERVNAAITALTDTGEIERLLNQSIAALRQG